MYNFVGEAFINAFKQFKPDIKVASGGKELVTRCIFCGDSENQRHAHFYISVPQSVDELSFYQCKRCPNQGIVNDDLLRKLGCSDNNFIIDFIKHNSEVLSLPKYKSLKKINIYPLKYDLIRIEQTNIEKLNYINNRIGSNFSYKDIVNLKIFLNLYDIINANNLELTRHKLICDALDSNFIGFISYDNSYCGLRKITNIDLHPSINKRYINYSFINKVDDRKNFYIIPTEVDILNPLPVNIHIAEGQFDILSIFYNLNHCNRLQNIYIACCGKSYLQALEFILQETGIINYIIHYYPDKDVSDYEIYNSTLKKIQMLKSTIIIHRNVYANEKDFGVPISRIKEDIKIFQ